MYDELVEKMRCCYGQLRCGDCRFVEDCAGKEMLLKAADAIEELSSAGSIYGKAWTLGYDAGRDENSQRWISVTERLPPEWWPVLGLIQFHDEKEPPAQEVLWYLGNGHWRETWRGDMIESAVTHWMQLPEPPKEEH